FATSGLIKVLLKTLKCTVYSPNVCEVSTGLGWLIWAWLETADRHNSRINARIKDIAIISYGQNCPHFTGSGRKRREKRRERITGAEAPGPVPRGSRSADTPG